MIGSYISINGVSYCIIDVDNSDNVEVLLHLKDTTGNEHTLMIEKLSYKFLKNYGETEIYYYNFDGIYDNRILNLIKL